MLITFDPAKDSANYRKHGVLLSFAVQLDWHMELAWVDKRYSYDELRMSALVPCQDTLYYVAYVDRTALTCEIYRRIISLRRTTRSETLHYLRDL